MRIFTLIAIVLIGCHDQKDVQSLSIQKQQIDKLIQSQDRFAKVCYEDSFFKKVAGDKIDTSVRTFFCDSIGKIYIIKRTWSWPRSKPVYWTYFSKGKVIKIVMDFSVIRNEYYIEHDTIIGRKENNSGDYQAAWWISETKTDYRQFDSIKRIN